jgi:hypothetical protein
MMWNPAMLKQLKQFPVLNRESVGGQGKVSEWNLFGLEDTGVAYSVCMTASVV